MKNSTKRTVRKIVEGVASRAIWDAVKAASGRAAVWITELMSD